MPQAPARYYVTTPIYYVSDVPHLGHAYTTIVADAIARYQRMRRPPSAVAFLTGTDDHGQKIERNAAERGTDPGSYASRIAAVYQATWSRLGISNDDFIRTSDPRHEAVVLDLWNRMVESGDIYLRDYEGWYCVACEQFYLDKELAEGNLCPVHRRSVERVKEKNFFFRLGAYQTRLQELYDRRLRETGRPFVEPANRMNEVRAFVDSGLQDISVSRTNFRWGIPVPGHPDHVIYVWIDALTNYYSVTRDEQSRLAGFWADDVEIVHLIGKEISRFHAVYWPAMLMSAGLRPPSRVFAHGWWTVDGEKMSKTRGNVVDPVRLADDLGADAFRYFVLREIPLGADGDFSHEALLQRYNAELANDLGNLLNRTLGMVSRYLGADVAWHASEDPRLTSAVTAASSACSEAMEQLNPAGALTAIWALVREGNTYIEREAPWKQKGAAQEAILWNALETVRIIAHLVHPFLPERAGEMLRQLGREAEAPHAPGWGAGRAFHVRPGEPLFPRIDDRRRSELLERWAPRPQAPPPEVGAAPAPGSGAAPEDDDDDAEAQAGEPSTQGLPVTLQGSPPATAGKPTVQFDEFQKLDLRVALVTAAERVPGKDKLLKLTVDAGASAPRTIVAGIATAYAPEQLVGRRVLLLANLKPAKIGGIVSEGMVLAAGEDDIVGLATVDASCPPGTRVR